MSEEFNGKTFALTQTLRMNGFITETDYLGRNLKGNFKQADRLLASFLILVGEDEEKEHIYTIKNNQTKEEYQVDQDYIVMFLDEKLQELESSCDDHCQCGHHECHCKEGGCHHHE